MGKQNGFTLIEIAIVLVIIGLLLGGILKGQELINQAKIKNVANDMNGVSVAVYAYQDRYRAFPGDDNGSAARWNLAAADINGDKDGQLAGEFCSGGVPETRKFWRALRLAGLISGDSASGEQPQNAVGGITGVQTNSGPADAPVISGLVVCTTNLPGKIASAIDSQFDNGASATGAIRGYTQTGPVGIGCATAANPTRGAAADNYVDDTATLYTVCRGI